MKRPFLTIGLTLFICCVFLESFSRSYFLTNLLSLLSVAGIILCLLIKKLKKHTVIALCLFAVLLSCLNFYIHTEGYNNTVTFCGESKLVTATVKQAPEYDSEYSRYYCTVKIGSIDGKKASGNMRISFSESYDDITADMLCTGDKISFNATITQTGSYNGTIRYFKSQGTYLSSYKIRNLTVASPKYRPVTYYTQKLQQYISKTFSNQLPRDISSLMTALVTGNKDNLDDDIYQTFKASGIAHIMAVSGLHLSVLVLFLSSLLDKTRLHKLLKFIILSFCVILIMALASFSASVKRAGIMMLIYLLGKLLSKASDSLNSLGLSAFCLLIANPFSVFDVSFLLSFLSSFSILYVALPINKIIAFKLKLNAETTFKALLKTVLQSITISVSVVIFTSLITCLYFGNICLASPLTNLLVIPVIPVLLICAVLFLALFNISVFDILLTPIINIFSFYCLKVAEFFSKLSFLNIKAQTDAEITIAVAVFLTLMVISVIFSSKMRKKYAHIL